MIKQFTPSELRVLGALMEKEITTPEAYPLSLNALTAACNQKSNRDPVLSLTETEVQGVVDLLKAKHVVMVVAGSRTQKYKQRFCNTEFSNWQFSPQEAAVLCLLFLRGPQTPGELRTRSQRLAQFADVNGVEQVLMQLHNHEKGSLVLRLEREPGKRECRYCHCFSQDSEAGVSASKPSQFHSAPQGNGPVSAAQPVSNEPPACADASGPSIALEDRVQVLERRLASLEQRLDLLEGNT